MKKMLDFSRYRSYIENGDGKYWKDNWINNYEGRIYDSGGPGQEWWSMNCQRYSKYKEQLDKFDDKIIAYQNYNQKLKDGDLIKVFPPISGG